MNWGKGIIVGMTVFVVFIVVLCIYMITSPLDSFDRHYYEKGLNFDQDYNREEQVIKDHAKPLIAIDGRQIRLTFSQPAIGTVKFIRPSSSSSDKVYKLNTGNDATADFSIESFPPGNWQLVLEWESNNKAYLYQQEIYIK